MCTDNIAIFCLSPEKRSPSSEGRAAEEGSSKKHHGSAGGPGAEGGTERKTSGHNGERLSLDMNRLNCSVMLEDKLHKKGAADLVSLWAQRKIHRP